MDEAGPCAGSMHGGREVIMAAVPYQFQSWTFANFFDARAWDGHHVLDGISVQEWSADFNKLNK